jgi:hypothetical protein
VKVGAGDPGLKPGYVELGARGEVLRASHRLEAWVLETPWDVFATEGQWYFGERGAERGRVNVNDLLVLAFRAGFTLACIPAERSLRIPPKEWRSDIGGPQLTKAQVQKKIATSLTDAERQLFSTIPRTRHGDVLDAIGIARCARRVAPLTTKFDWTLK